MKYIPLNKKKWLPQTFEEFVTTRRTKMVHLRRALTTAKTALKNYKKGSNHSELVRLRKEVRKCEHDVAMKKQQLKQFKPRYIVWKGTELLGHYHLQSLAFEAAGIPLDNDGEDEV